MKNWIRLGPVKAMILASEPPVWVNDNLTIDASTLVAAPSSIPKSGSIRDPPDALAEMDPIVLLQ